MYDEVYAQQAMETGPTFQEHYWRQVECPECRLEVAAVLLLTYCQIQHGMGRGDRDGGTPPPPPPNEAQTYRVSFPKQVSLLW